MFLLTACSGVTDPIEDPAQSNQDSEDTVTITLDPPRVTLLDAGDATKVLTYGIPTEEADTQLLPVRLGGGFSTLIDPDTGLDTTPPAEPDNLPVLNFDAEATVRAVDGDTVTAEETGATRRVTITARTPRFAGGDPRLTSYGDSDIDWNTELAGADGFTLSYATTPSGKPLTMSLHAPESASDISRASMETKLGSLVTLAVVFPGEPVGPGARWTVESRITGSTTMLQTVTYTLTSLNDRTVSLNVEVDQRPSIGALSLDAILPPGADGTSAGELRVQSTETTSTGRLDLDLGDPLPNSGGVAFTTRIIYTGDGSDIRVVQDSHTATHFG